MRLTPFALTPFALLLVLPCAAHAQEAAPATERALGGDRLMVGIGVASVPDYEGSNDSRIVPAPGAIGSIGGHKFMLVGNRASLDLLKDKPGPGWDFELGPVAAIGFNRASLKGIEDPRIRALGKLGYAVELGGYAGIARQGVITSDYDRLSLSVSYRHDVAGGHGGAMIMPTINYMTPLSTKSMVTIFASAAHADRDYADSYYTITPAQSAASGLPAFKAGSGWKSWSVGGAANLSLTGDLTQGLSAVAGLVYTKLLNDFADSPVTSIAGSRDQLIFGAGLAFTF